MPASMLMAHKELTYSYREGIDEKLKCMAQPCKTKVLKKMSNSMLMVRNELSNS